MELGHSKTNQAQYKIHYKGWNKRWDEWVDQRRLLKSNESSKQIMSQKNSENKQKQLQQQQQQQSQSNHSKSPSPNSHSGKKRKLRQQSKAKNDHKKRKLNTTGSDDENDRDDSEDSDDDHEGQQNGEEQKSDRIRKEDDKNKNNANNNNNNNNGKDGDNMNGTGDSLNNIPLEIKLPTKLKRKLITDWENITKKKMLIQLPRNEEQRISTILTDFQNFAIHEGQDRNIVTEISRGIKDYFNQALQVTLLYKLERKQHEQLISQHPQLTMDQIYGVEHLCRLFVKLPQLLSPNDLDNDTRHILSQQIQCMIQFLLNGEDKYFNTKYTQS